MANESLPPLDIDFSRPEFLGGEQWHVKTGRRLNILMGKNGSGKSELLRALAAHATSFIPDLIPPERGGFLIRDASTETTIENNPNWDLQTRRDGNQTSNFRQRVIFKLNRFKISVLDEMIELDSKGRTYSRAFKGIR